MKILGKQKTLCTHPLIAKEKPPETTQAGILVLLSPEVSPLLTDPKLTEALAASRVGEEVCGERTFHGARIRQKALRRPTRVGWSGAGLDSTYWRNDVDLSLIHI